MAACIAFCIHSGNVDDSSSTVPVVCSILTSTGDATTYTLEYGQEWAAVWTSTELRNGFADVSVNVDDHVYSRRIQFPALPPDTPPTRLLNTTWSTEGSSTCCSCCATWGSHLNASLSLLLSEHIMLVTARCMMDVTTQRHSKATTAAVTAEAHTATAARRAVATVVEPALANGVSASLDAPPLHSSSKRMTSAQRTSPAAARRVSPRPRMPPSPSTAPPKKVGTTYKSPSPTSFRRLSERGATSATPTNDSLGKRPTPTKTLSSAQTSRSRAGNRPAGVEVRTRATPGKSNREWEPPATVSELLRPSVVPNGPPSPRVHRQSPPLRPAPEQPRSLLSTTPHGLQQRLVRRI